MNDLAQRWNELYFNGRLSPTVLQNLAALEEPAQRSDVRDFLERIFSTMQQARFPATAFTVDLTRQLNHIVRLVRDAWQGAIPPFTLEERHRKLDDYLENHPWFQANPNGTLLDVGCGFPPLTTVATAVRFPNWQVIGLDPALPHYLVEAEQGDYALFNENGELQYFQGGQGRSLAVWRDPAAAKAHFTDLLHQLQSQPVANGAGTAVAEAARLVQNPVQQYERPNLTFKNGRIGELNFSQIDVIRCFNVLFYFDAAFRQWALGWFASILREGGLVICGVNGFLSTRCRYTVWQQQDGRLAESEFAFSLDNVRPLGAISWSAFHDDDKSVQRLARLVGVIRKDAHFRHAFDARLDSLLTEYGLFERDAAGYLHEMAAELVPRERESRQQKIGEQLAKEGYVLEAVAVLRRAGLQAWRNHAGHIAVGL